MTRIRKTLLSAFVLVSVLLLASSPTLAHGYGNGHHNGGHHAGYSRNYGAGHRGGHHHKQHGHGHQLHGYQPYNNRAYGNRHHRGGHDSRGFYGRYPQPYYSGYAYFAYGPVIIYPRSAYRARPYIYPYGYDY